MNNKKQPREVFYKKDVRKILSIFTPSRHGCILDASLRRPRDISKGADLHISEIACALRLVETFWRMETIH